MAGLHITEDDLLFADGDVSVTFNSSTGNYVFDVDADIVNAVGNDTEIQFNDQGTFGSSPDLTFDNSNGLSTKGLVLNSDGSLVDSFASVKDQTGSDVVTFNEAGLGFSRDRSRYAVDTRGGRIRSGKLPPVDNLSASSNVSGSLEVEYYVCAVDKSGAHTEAKKVTVPDVPENTKAFGISEIYIETGDSKLRTEGFQSVEDTEISVGEQFNLYYVYYDGGEEEFRFSDDTFEAQEQVVTVKSLETDGSGFVDSIVIEETLPYEPSNNTLAYIYEAGTTEKVDVSWDPVEDALFYGIGKKVPSRTGKVVFVGRTTSTSFEDFTTGTTNFDSDGGFENFPSFAPGGTGIVQNTANRNKTGDVYVDGNLAVGNPNPDFPSTSVPLDVLHKKELGSAGEARAVRIEQDITELDSVLDSNFNQQDYLAVDIDQTIKPETPGNTDSGVADMQGISLNINTEAALSALGIGMSFDGSFDEVRGYTVGFRSGFSATASTTAFQANMGNVDTGFSQFRWPRAFEINEPSFDTVNGSDEWFGLYVGGENPYNQIGGQVNIGDSDRADQDAYYLNIKQIDGDTSKGFFNVALQPNNSPLFSIRNSEEILLAGENKVNITAPKVEISEPTDGSSTEQILTRNPNTGEIEKISSLDISAIASTGILAGLGLESTFNASTGVTTLDVDIQEQDIDEQFEGDFILKKASTGGLITLNKSSSSTVFEQYDVIARYEGDGAFTIGKRVDGSTIGQLSIALGVNTISSGEASTAMGEETVASGEASTAMGGATVASNDASVAMGGATEASGRFSTAMGTNTTASGEASTAMGDVTTAAADSSTAVGFSLISRVFGGTVQGVYNEDYVGSGNEVEGVSNLSTDSRIFVVGVGDKDTLNTEDPNYFDGREEVDGFYVTYRDGTHVRHGLSLDAYDETFEEYELEFRIPERIQAGTDASQVLVRNPNTKELEYVDGSTLGGGMVLAGLGLTSTFNASTGDTTFNVDAIEQDTESNFILQDSSTGELITLDDGGSPALGAKYEGNGAFTLGYRDKNTNFGGVGENSIVIGGSSDNSTLAGEKNSIAIGVFARVLGGSFFNAESGIAIGNQMTVSGNYSVSIGNTTTSGDSQTVEGEESLGLGHKNNVDAPKSYVIGYDQETTANSNRSIVFGSTDSSGNGSIVNSSEDAISIGNAITIDSADKGIVIGTSNTIDSANRAVSIGDGSTINSSDDSTSIGNSNTIDSANKAVTIGDSNEINDELGNGDESVTIGYSNVVSGENSFVFGKSNQSNNQALLLGSNLNYAVNNSSTSSLQRTIIGQYNQEVDTFNAEFVVGIGDGGFRQNGLVIYKDTAAITQTDTIVFDASESYSDKGFGSISGSIIGRNATGGGVTIAPNSSFLFPDTDLSENHTAIRTLAWSSTLQANASTTDAMVFKSIIGSSGGSLDADLGNSFIIESEINSTNFSEFESSGEGLGKFFAYDNKTLVAFKDTGGASRDGSVIISGGSIGGSIQSSVAIASGSVSANNSVAIGGSASVSTSNTIAIGDTGGTKFYGGDVTIVDDEIDIQTPGNGVVVTTPDGTTQYRIAVDNNGNVTSEEV